MTMIINSTNTIPIDSSSKHDPWLVQQPRWRDGLLLFMIIGTLFTFMLGSRPLSAPDEGRYAEIPREMALSNDYVTPRLNGIKYFEKPPLMYWLTSGSIKALSMNEWTLRLWPALLGFITCLSVYLTGARFLSRRSGFYAALVLSTTVLFYAHARLLILDMGVSCFLTISLCSYLWATQARTRREKNTALALFFTACAGSTLTKGLMGMAIPGSIILLWTTWRRDTTALKLAFTPWGIGLFLALTLPWHVLAHYRNAEFFDFYFYREHFLRYLTPIHGRSQPWWFFIPIILVGLFPWTSWLFTSFDQQRNRLSNESLRQFIIVWIGFVTVFFSLSDSKLIPYILPVFPPLALWLGHTIASSWQNQHLIRKYILLKALIAIILATAIPIALNQQELWHNLYLQRYGLIIVVILGLYAGYHIFLTTNYALRFRYSQARQTIVATFIFGYIFLPILNAAWPYIDHRSVKSLAMVINERRQSHEPIVTFGRYYQDLPPYVNERVIIVGWQGELEHGLIHNTAQDWVITKEQFFHVYKTLGKVYIVTRKEFLPELQKPGMPTFEILATTEKDILITTTP